MFSFIFENYLSKCFISIEVIAILLLLVIALFITSKKFRKTFLLALIFPTIVVTLLFLHHFKVIELGSFLSSFCKGMVRFGLALLSELSILFVETTKISFLASFKLPKSIINFILLMNLCISFVVIYLFSHYTSQIFVFVSYVKSCLRLNKKTEIKVELVTPLEINNTKLKYKKLPIHIINSAYLC